MSTHLRTPLHLVALTSALALCGCGITNPYAPKTSRSSRPPARVTAALTTTSSPAPAGELPSPLPPSAVSQAPADLSGTPVGALRQFASRYVNWTWRTLVADQLTLAAMSVGAARLSEQQAAAASGADSTITRGQIRNSGQLVSVSRSLTAPGEWVLVTRESTAGNPAYAGLQAAYHVTLATLARVPGGYAVSQWQPQN